VRAIVLLLLAPMAIAAGEPRHVLPSASTLQSVVAALIGKDDKTVLRLTRDVIVYVDAEEFGRPRGKGSDRLPFILSLVAKCDVGAITRNYSTTPGYVINWWCKYTSQPNGYFPSEGASAVITMNGTKAEISNFKLNGPYGTPPRSAKPEAE
jgi:hypothetical protein